ncbi:MAG: peptide chain release factor N(5)-glutamine methyltransferase [Candidatus Omnitrophota bacterium]|jgi:release factor glutamine methyltransferase
MNESELLFCEILGCDRASLYRKHSLSLDKDKSALISSALKRRISSEPIQYILGKTEFMGLEFKLSPGVFIPRPETEILVEAAMDIVHNSQRTVQNILDLGTGSGCIAVSLAKLMKNVRVVAADISKEALEIAEQNARLNNVEIGLFQSDLFASRELRARDYELIISNPPYIPSAEIDDLQPEIRYEPRRALDGGKDGLDFYRRIINAAGRHLKIGGFLIMEMGFNQKSAIKNIFQNSGNFEIIKIVKDYNNIDRVIVTGRVR